MKEKKKILVICPFPQGIAAGQRLKYEQYFDYWRQNGYDITVSSFMDMAMWNIVYAKGNLIQKIWGTLRGQFRRIGDIFRLQRYDLVYVFMWITPVGTSLFERIYRTLSKKLVYDIEDNILIDKGNDFNPLVKLLRVKSKIKYLIRTANHVISSSPFLNDYCLQLNKFKRGTYVSSSVNTDKYQPINRFTNEEKIRIGWTGTFGSMQFLDLLRPAFIELKKQRDYKLVVIGNFDYEFPGIDLEVIRWRKETEIEDLQKIDIGVYPLPITNYVLGKSGLKAIQYMAIGIPTVATNVGTTPRIIRHLENGWLVKTNEEWIEALRTLIDDPGLRRRLGLAARKTIEESYSIKAIRQQYLSILNEVTKS